MVYVHLDNPVFFAPPAFGSWQNVTLDNIISVPGSVKGVAVAIGAHQGYGYGITSGGVTNDLKGWPWANNASMIISYIGLDQYNRFRVYQQSDAFDFTYLLGYFTDGVEFFSNGLGLVLNTAQTYDWSIVDASAMVPSDATGLIVQAVERGGASYCYFGYRPIGATTNIAPKCLNGISPGYHFIPLDDEKKFQAKTYLYAPYTPLIYLVGYTTAKSGIEFLPHPQQAINVTNVNTYENKTVATSSKLGALIYAPFSVFIKSWVRHPTQTFDITAGLQNGMFISTMDNNRRIQIKSSDAAATYYISAYLKNIKRTKVFSHQLI